MALTAPGRIGAAWRCCVGGAVDGFVSGASARARSAVHPHSRLLAEPCRSQPCHAPLAIQRVQTCQLGAVSGFVKRYSAADKQYTHSSPLTLSLLHARCCSCIRASVSMFRNEVLCHARGLSRRDRRIFLHCLAVSCAPSGLRHPLKYNPVVHLPRPVPVSSSLPSTKLVIEH